MTRRSGAIIALSPDGLLVDLSTDWPLQGPDAGAHGQSGDVTSPEQLAQWLRQHDSVAHTTALRAAGFTTHAIRSAVAAGIASWVRRSWLALPNAPAPVRVAVAAGGRLTCLSEAGLSGLWTPEHEQTHVAVASTASRVERPGLRLHWSKPIVPVGTTAVREPLVNVLAHVAACVPVADALSVWESALRKQRISAAEIERVQWHGTAARSIAARASLLSDSGLETVFVGLMRSIGVVVRQQVRVDGRPIDAIIGDLLAVQIDGFAHHQAADRRRDLRADARLVLRGYTVLRFDYYQILFCPDEVIATIRMAMAQGLHLAPAHR